MGHSWADAESSLWKSRTELLNAERTVLSSHCIGSCLINYEVGVKDVRVRADGSNSMADHARCRWICQKTTFCVSMSW